MSVIRFRPPDLAHTRFAISPARETVVSWGVQRRPERRPDHRAWVTAARRSAARPSFAGHARLLDALVRAHAWTPDFLTPPPPSASPDFEDELAAVAATPPEVVRDDIAATERKRPVMKLGRQVAEDPVTWLPAVVEALRAWHHLAIAPHWPRMQTVLEADIAYRAATFAERGPGWMFESMHASLRWQDDRLRVDDAADLDVRLAGKGLPVLPSLFHRGAPVLTARPMLVYRARDAGSFWDTRRTPPEATLAALVGPSRARVMALLEAPVTTTSVATRLRLAPAAVSSHLKVLHEAGLASRHRHGREVFYVLTDLGRRLLAAPPALRAR